MGILILAILLIVFVLPISADPAQYSYRVQITQNNQPLPDVYVRIAGVGVEMTDAQGIAVFDLSEAVGRGAGRQQLFRGPIYAALKGKLSGSVADEWNLFQVQITSHDIGEVPIPDTYYVNSENVTVRVPGESSFAYGTQVYLKLNTLYEIKL